MTIHLQEAIQELTAQPSTEHPFLSIYLDWRTDDKGRRQSPTVLDQELTRIAGELSERGVDLTGFTADQERIMQYVANEAPDDANGLAIFACNAEGLWATMALQMPVETEVIEDRHPHVFNLVQMMDDHETYAVVLGDSQEAHILVIALNQVEQAAETQAAEDIKRFQAGGQAQMIFQRRTANLVKAHTKDITTQLTEIVRRYQVQHIVIGANDSVKGPMLASLTDQLKEKLVDYINLDPKSNLKTLMETLEPMMRDVERQQEADEVADLEDRVATKGGLGMVGVANIATALTKGQVDRLLILQSFSGVGGECPNCGTVRPGQRPTCPYDGTEMQPVDLREAFIARAIQQGATVQVVEANPFLEQHEGVGALLRYRDDEQAATT